jgi:uncharacterized protein YigE (DUF2233 family)
MSLSSNKILVANVLTNQAAGYFQTITVSNIGAGNATAMNAGVTSAQYIPAGWYVLPNATNNVTIEINAGTSNANAWTTYIASNTGGTIISDGWNVRANNVTTGTQTLTLYGLSQGQNATGQYNAS